MMTVEPMPHLPVVKDMVVDMDDFFDKYEYVMPWLIRNSPDPAKEINQSPDDREKLNMPVDCILCGSCYSSCPSAWGEENYIGPAALLKAYRFEVDSRDEAKQGAHAPLEQRAWRVPLPHHHELPGSVPEGAEPDRGHPVAQEGRRSAEAVRQGQVKAPGDLATEPGRAAAWPV